MLMSQNKFTTNNNPTLVAVSNADGETPVYIYADPTSHGLLNGGGTMPGLNIPSHDEIVLSYTGANLTGVVYKLATVTKATLTLSYSGSDLIGVVKT